MGTPSIEKIEAEIFSPALQQASQQALDTGYSLNDLVFGAANAYILMLIRLVGTEQAKNMLEDQARILKDQINKQVAE